MANQHNPSHFLSTLTTRILPIEGGPLTEAMLNGSGVAVAPWGHFASTMIEQHEHLELDDVLNLLGIEASDLGDTTRQFADSEQYYLYRHARQETLYAEEKKDLDVEVQRLKRTAGVVKSAFEISNQSDAYALAGSIQAEIEKARDDFRLLLSPTEEEERGHNVQQFLRTTERDALESGYSGTLAYFLELALNTNITGTVGLDVYRNDSDDETTGEQDLISEDFNNSVVKALTDRDFDVEPSDLASTWLNAIRFAMDQLMLDYSSSALESSVPKAEFGVVTSKLIIGREFLDFFIMGLDDTSVLARRRSQNIWDTYLKPIFESGNLSEHSLVTGKDVK